MRFKSVEKRCREKMEDYQKHTTNERSEMSINLMTENMKKRGNKKSDGQLHASSNFMAF
jgi:hypothetical protein